jgi:hypothetical protein
MSRLPALAPSYHVQYDSNINTLYSRGDDVAVRYGSDSLFLTITELQYRLLHQTLELDTAKYGKIELVSRVTPVSLINRPAFHKMIDNYAHSVTRETIGITAPPMCPC